MCAGHFTGLGPNLNNGHKLINLQYEDDTLLFLKADLVMVDKIQWILKAFEGISGLRINYAKSELIPLNISTNLAESLADSLHCKIGDLPLTYLGLPLHWKKPHKRNWQDVIDRIQGKLPTWKEKMLSLGGRLTLVNSVLSALPLYMLSGFKCPSWAIKAMDKVRRSFLWSGSEDKKKMALVSWKSLILKNEHGGWGILDLSQMNKALLSKWGWRFLEADYSGIWKELVRHKYGLKIKANMSHFWTNVSSLLPLLRLGYSVEANSRVNTNFWYDKWISNLPLYKVFPNLYAKCKKDNLLVSEVWADGRLKLPLKRGATRQLRQEKVELLRLLRNHNFNGNSDIFIWHWDNKGFTVSSFYQFLNCGGVTIRKFDSIWPIKILLKIKLFCWLVNKNRILTKDNLISRGWHGDNKCAFCDSQESIDHLFLHCSYVNTFWNFFNSVGLNGVRLQLDTVSSIWNQFFSLPSASRNSTVSLIASFFWAVWLERNRVIFQQSDPKPYFSTYTTALALFNYWTGGPAAFAEQLRHAQLIVVPAEDNDDDTGENGSNPAHDDPDELGSEDVRSSFGFEGN